MSQVTFYKMCLYVLIMGFEGFILLFLIQGKNVTKRLFFLFQILT